jgi:hypothetical protein
MEGIKSGNMDGNNEDWARIVFILEAALSIL